MSRLSLDPEALRVQSFATGRALYEPAEFTNVVILTPKTGEDQPTITGCTCFETCFGGVCRA